MRQYKINQKIYHKTALFDDRTEKFDFELLSFDDYSLIQEKTILYFCADMPLIYPAKSYSVAIIYSLLLKKYFNITINDSLSDHDLFLGTDKFFEPLNEKNERVYKLTLTQLEQKNLLDVEKNSLFQVRKTIDYFYKECLLKDFIE